MGVLLLMAILREYCILTLPAGESGNMKKGWREGQRSGAEMTRQMVDWRLSLWEETPGSQLEEGTATLRQLEDQSKLVIFDHDI